MKKCNSCQEFKEFTVFAKCKSKKDGLQPRCKDCDKIIKKKWYEKNREKSLAYRKEWSKNNPDKRKKCEDNWRKNHPEKVKEFNRKWNRNNYKKIKNIKLLYKYGITLEQKEDILAQQNNVCAICLKPETQVDKRTGKTMSLAVDHDHKTNKIRGLLCLNCNHLLGKAKDDINILKRAIEYLDRK